VRNPFQIDRGPQHDGIRHQIEAASPVALLLKAAVADFSQAVEEYGAGQRVAGFALVQPSMHAATQFHALQLFQDEQSALDAPQLAQGHGQAVLAGELPGFLSISDAVTVPCLIEVGSRRISSQWARTYLMLSVPPIIGLSAS
jgi:hypothetical protein